MKYNNELLTKKKSHRPLTWQSVKYSNLETSEVLKFKCQYYKGRSIFENTLNFLGKDANVPMCVAWHSVMREKKWIVS